MALAPDTLKQVLTTAFGSQTPTLIEVATLAHGL